ncbi:MAG: hypothetical protein GY941_21720 [Planctomycetes bacterium]|nr:hypothetical protein [Planctomycetota bacterium]
MMAKELEEIEIEPTEKSLTVLTEEEADCSVADRVEGVAYKNAIGVSDLTKCSRKNLVDAMRLTAAEARGVYKSVARVVETDRIEAAEAERAAVETHVKKVWPNAVVDKSLKVWPDGVLTGVSDGQ